MVGAFSLQHLTRIVNFRFKLHFGKQGITPLSVLLQGSSLGSSTMDYFSAQQYVKAPVIRYRFRTLLN
jgi:hypothetical protein